MPESVRTALLVFPTGDPGQEAAEAACAGAGWSCERSAQPTLALVRLIRPAAGKPVIGLLIVSAAATGLGAQGLAKAARSNGACRDLPVIIVGGAADLERCRCVAVGDAPGITAAIAAVTALAADATPATDDGGLLDQEAIGALRSLPEVWTRALAAFTRDLPGHLAELERIAASGDLQALHRVAHALKGAAGSIGAASLHQALARLDQAAQQGEGARVAAQVPAIRPLAERSLAALGRIRT